MDTGADLLTAPVPDTTCDHSGDWMQPVLHEVVSTRRENPDTVTLDLRPLDGGECPSYTPGQCNMLSVFGIGEVPISISGDPAKRDVYTHTIRGVGAVTRAFCAMKPGAVVGVRGPYGRGWPVAEAEGLDLVFVAGGIGLAPLRPALYAALAHRERFGKIVVLLGARLPEDLLYKSEVQKWRARFDVGVEITVDSARDGWRGDVGVVTRLIPRVGFDPLHAAAFVCGPDIMMRYAAQDLVKRGVDPARIAVSLERNMKCMIGQCGHCQIGAWFPCVDGPVFPYATVERIMRMREV